MRVVHGVDSPAELTRALKLLAARGDGEVHQVLEDALLLLEGEGELIMARGIGFIHVDPSWLIDIVKELADHQLRDKVGSYAQTLSQRVPGTSQAELQLSLGDFVESEV